MSSINIIRSSDVVRTARVMQVEGIFDIPPSRRSAESWDVDLTLPNDWNIGVIVGPSGSGKTTIAHEIFKDDLVTGYDWSTDNSILDGFPASMSIKEITDLLSSVGFSSPPSWVRPFGVLSNGEQFRVSLARALADSRKITVVDEFTSVVDRTVAKIASAAVAKTVRRRNQRFVAVTCHYDILEWLEPDWVYETATNTLTVGRHLQRPRIELEIIRVHHTAWNLFRKHHYLDTKLNTMARCFCAFWQGVPIAFTAVLHFPHATARNVKREHRTVCLPDFQGVGIGNALSNAIGSMARGNGWRYLSQTSHPAMIRSRAASPYWKMIAKPNNTTKSMPYAANGIRSVSGQSRGIVTRLRATFEYVGPAMTSAAALQLWGKTP